MSKDELFLGADGGGTRCRARLCDASGLKLAEAQAGPANIRLGLKEAFASVLDVTLNCLEQAHLSSEDLPRITACLALAGATEPAELAAAKLHEQPFGRAILTSDAHAACVGAHDGRDGAVLIHRHGQHWMGRAPRQAPPGGGDGACPFPMRGAALGSVARRCGAS